MRPLTLLETEARVMLLSRGGGGGLSMARSGRNECVDGKECENERVYEWT